MSSLRFLLLEQPGKAVLQVCESDAHSVPLLPLFQVHEYLRSKLCSLYENDCIFDKFECCWNGSDRQVDFLSLCTSDLLKLFLKWPMDLKYLVLDNIVALQ